MDAPNLTITLFILGCAVPFALEAIKMTGKLRWTLATVAGVFVVAGVLWLPISSAFPRIAGFVGPIAANPMSWFLLLFALVAIARERWSKTSDGKAVDLADTFEANRNTSRIDPPAGQIGTHEGADPSRRIDEIAKIAAEAAARAQAAEAAYKATASHAASINQGHLDLKRRFEEATTKLEDRIGGLEEEQVGLRKQIQSQDEGLAALSQAVAARLDGRERYEDAKIQLEAIRTYEQKLSENWPSWSQGLKQGDPSAAYRRALFTLSPDVSLPENNAPLNGYYASLSAGIVPEGSHKQVFEALEFYQRRRRAIDEGIEDATKVIRAYEEDQKRRLEANRQEPA